MAIRPKVKQRVIVAGYPAPGTGTVRKIERHPKMIIYVVRLDSGKDAWVSGSDLTYQK